MDLAQVFIFDLGWIFFVAWGMVLVAVSAIAFGRDFFPSFSSKAANPNRDQFMGNGVLRKIIN
jgi:hypothetical protein